MNKLIGIWKIRRRSIAGLLLIAFFISGSFPQVFAHGGEDHGDGKPKTTAEVKGTVSHTARLGDFEIMVKHNAIEPDIATVGRLFITNFQTNAPAEKISSAVEIESANGTVTPITIEKTDSSASYNLKIPALSEGIYTIRTKVTYGGETDTATFSGVQVETAHVAAEGNIAAWGRTILITLSALIVLALFGGLIFYAFRAAKSGQSREEAISV